MYVTGKQTGINVCRLQCSCKPIQYKPFALQQNILNQPTVKAFIISRVKVNKTKSPLANWPHNKINKDNCSQQLWVLQRVRDRKAEREWEREREGGVCVSVCVRGFLTHPVLPPSVLRTGINECTDGHSLISSNRQQWKKPHEDILRHAHHHHYSGSANKGTDNWRC